MATGRRRARSEDQQRFENLRAAVAERAFEMEEPLRNAANLCQAIRMAARPYDEEVEALAFVASEAHSRLLTVADSLRGLFNDIRIDHGVAKDRKL